MQKQDSKKVKPKTMSVPFSEISICGILSPQHYLSGEHKRKCHKKGKLLSFKKSKGAFQESLGL